ncbi:MAG: AAA family ATPase [Polyangiaceae bacterium]
MAPTSLIDAASSLRAALGGASEGLVDREVIVELVALAAVAREHMLVIGPPGTAKSEAVRRVSASLGARYFEYLLGRFTEPSEILGPVDLRRLREGVVETETAGMLPEAEIAFLDEVFLGSTAILNTLLGVLNERVFRRGHTHKVCPLRVCVGASNSVPDDESLAAFADRFLVRAYLGPVGDPQLELLLEGGWASAQPRERPKASMADLDLLVEASVRADMTTIRPDLARALRLLRGAGIALSDRRSVKVQRLIAAAAALAGRASPTSADLWPIVYAVPGEDAQRMAREVLRDLLAPSENRALSAAVEDASAGPSARASRLLNAAESVFASPPSETDPDAIARWRLRLEGVAREMDAAFSSDSMPAALKAMRARIVSAVQGSA